jgi:hypothetical protein
MPGLLFLSQIALEAWAEQKKIEFQGNLMTLAAGPQRGRAFVLVPAVHFVKVLNTDQDPNQLLAKVKTEAQLRELGAEHLENSVVLGEIAYEVHPGFLAEDRALPTTATPKPQVVAKAGAPGLEASGAPQGRQDGETARAEPLPGYLEEKRKEAEALARFLLENLS